MRYYDIKKWEIKLLTWITKRIVIQSRYHKSNIITYYKIMTDTARDEFTEDNKVTLDSFLTQCFNKALK